MNSLRLLRAAGCLAGLLLAAGCSKLQDAQVVDGQACNLCHESPPDLRAMHVAADAATYDFPCSHCHLGYSDTEPSVNSEKHYNGEKTVVFDTAALNQVFPPYGEVRFENSTCSNIPCHGAGRMGKDNVVWNVNANIDDELSCNGCHDASQHRSGENCDNCHELVTGNGIEITNFSLHINGKVERDKRN